MPAALVLLLPLLAQVGPFTTAPQAPLEIPRKKRVESPSPVAPPPPLATTRRMSDCLAQAAADPGAAIETANTWAQTVKGQAAVDPARCRGIALGNLGRWNEATEALTMARDMESMRHLRAQYGAMAGNAALAAGNPTLAEALLKRAQADASIMPARFGGDIAIDRARALVSLKREDEAAAALSEGRNTSPSNPAAWLLSATLLRRQAKLGEAQAMIEKAAALAPLDPDIGLEAGVIAVLGGRDFAARRSWQSVLAAAPGSDQARTAQQYLDQLGPDTAPSTR